jgi:hypothetical protein
MIDLEKEHNFLEKYSKIRSNILFNYKLKRFNSFVLMKELLKGVAIMDKNG